MNILVTLNSGYVRPLCVMLRSLIVCNPDTHFEIYVANKSLSENDFLYIHSKISNEHYRLHNIKIDDSMLKDAPVTDRYPHEMYYRIFAAKFLPASIDRVLYLDPDLVILKPLDKLYNIPLGDNYFAAASHVGKPLQKINEIRLHMDTKGPYINSGVMLMNISLLRKEQNYEEVFDYIEKNRHILFLPDQDIISAVYCDKIMTIDPYVYNMTEKMLMSFRSIKNDVNFEWVQKNSAIVHYCGRNKPWKDNYTGMLDCFYKLYSADIN